MLVQLTRAANKKEAKQCSQVDMNDAAADFLLWTFQTHFLTPDAVHGISLNHR